jgi:hypothetical protein
MAWYMGIDIGSLYSKGVIIKDNELLVHYVVLSGLNYRVTAERIRDELLAKANITQADISDTVATGSGAGNVHFASQNFTDMICTARGIHSIFPTARTVIDVAAQSSKVIRVDSQGTVANFAVSSQPSANLEGEEAASFIAIHDTAAVQVVGRKLDRDLVTRQDANEVLAHLSRDMRQHLVLVLQFNFEHGIGQRFNDRGHDFNRVLFAHRLLKIASSFWLLAASF